MSSPRSTLAAPAQLAQDVRKSRFLANAANAPTPDAAIAFVTAVADTGATHNCWAYRAGHHYRFNDDGEPAGTAGSRSCRRSTARDWMRSSLSSRAGSAGSSSAPAA